MGFRWFVVGLIPFIVGACSTRPDGSGGGLDTAFSAQMASSWHWVDSPQRVQVGIFGSDAQGLRVVTGGSVDLSFSYLADGAGEPVQGPTATAEYVPVPGTGRGGNSPTLASGRGVYEAEGVVFDRPGVWQVAVSAEIDGLGHRLTATFVVTEDSPIPAPGDRAPPTRNLTLDSKGVPAAAIDSMAAGGGIPDPELHRWTVADAIEEGRPTLVLIGTPAFCTSRFCGPEVEELQRLARRYADRAVYIHIEVWRDYSAQLVNRAAAEWLLRDGDMTEPWLFLVGSDGIIVDRWGSLFDSADVAAALEALLTKS
jgi:hypothetical protein